MKISINDTEACYMALMRIEKNARMRRIGDVYVILHTIESVSQMYPYNDMGLFDLTQDLMVGCSIKIIALDDGRVLHKGETTAVTVTRFSDGWFMTGCEREMVRAWDARTIITLTDRAENYLLWKMTSIY